MNRVSPCIAHAPQSNASRFTASEFTASRFTASRLTAFRSITSRSTAFRSIASRSTTSKYTSNLDRSWPPGVSPNTQFRLPSASLSSLDLGLQVHYQTRSITASKCISEFTPSLGIQVHLQTHWILASKCISEFTQCQSPRASPNTLEHGLQVHLQGVTGGIRRYRGNKGGQSDGEYLFSRPQSR